MPQNVVIIASGSSATFGSGPIGAAPAPGPSITLSGPTTATAGSAATYTVTAANLTGAIVAAPVNVVGSAIFTPSTVNPAPGELSKLFSATWATAGTFTIRASSPGVPDSNALSVVVSAAPTPPPPPPPPPPASAPTATSGTASASLSSVAGATNEPVTFGLALARGAYPNTSGIAVVGLSAAQVEIRNTWPDNSAKFVVVSGRCTIPAGATITASVSRGTTPTGTALTEANLLAAGVDATLQFAGGPVMTLSSLIGVAAVSDATGLTTNGRVRQLSSGPQMSSWLYAARLSSTNAHVIGYMEVRFYGGGRVHILPWVENGFTRISGCAGQAGALIFTMGGTTRYNVADVHLANHCRVYAQSTGLGHWNGTAPDVYAAPDPSYLQSTGMVPPYFLRDTSAATTRLNGLAQNYSPTLYGQLTTSPRDTGGNGTDNGDFDAGMSNAGYHAGIGPLPEWDAFYLTSGDQRAWRAVVSNAMGYGRYGVHWRDELTLAPVNPTDVPNKTLSQTSIPLFGSTGSRNVYGISDVGANQFGGAETLPAAAGYVMGDGRNLLPEFWAQTHHPSAGFLAYLLTGHEAFAELCQMTAATCFLRQNNLHRGYGQGIQYTWRETNRGQAWALRTIFQAATISRDGSALQTGISTIAANNIAQYLADYVTSPCGSFGAPRPYSNFNADSGVAQYRVNAWELDFSVSAWGYGLSMQPPVGSTALANMASYFQWHAQWVTHRLGALGNAATYGFNAAARNNSVCIAPSFTDAPWIGNVGPWYATPGAVFQDTHGASNATNTTNSLGAFDGNNGFFPDATSYWGNLDMGLAFAVLHNAPGARDGYLRLINATNRGEFDTSAATNPVGALRASNSPPKWTQQALASPNTFVELPATQFYSWNQANLPAGAYRGTDPIGSPIDAYCDPAIAANGDQVIYGGGHGDGTNDGVVVFSAESLTYRYVKLPTPPSRYLPGYNRDISHPNYADPITYPSGAVFARGIGAPLGTFVEGIHSWHKGTAQGLDPVLDAAYAGELGRASTHMYGAAAMRGDVYHCFYLNYGELNTKTGKWGGYGVQIGAQLNAIQSNILADRPLQQGTFAIYDEVTDRFVVTLQPGDSGGANRNGVFWFDPNTRQVELIRQIGPYVLPSSPLVKVGRRAWLFRKVQVGTYLDPHDFNQGAIFDLDTKTLLGYFSIEGNPAATGSVAMSVNQETCPAIFDGTRIVRWNYDATNRNTVHFIDPNQTPVGGTGTSGDPWRYVQTSRAISNAPSSITYAYTRWAYVPRANAILFIPRANANYRALYLP